jgi:AbrB family looped-hinge helix DNA binding protein
VVTDRGQVTIPSQIRRVLGIEPGTRLRFDADGGRLIAVKETLENPVTRVFGAAGKVNTDKIMDRLRGGKNVITAWTLLF